MRNFELHFPDLLNKYYKYYFQTFYEINIRIHEDFKYL